MLLYSPIHLLKNDFIIYSKPSRVLNAVNKVVKKKHTLCPIELTS